VALKPDKFFVLNADVCCSFPLNVVLKLFEDKDAEAVILAPVSAKTLLATLNALCRMLIPSESYITSRSPNHASLISSIVASICSLLSASSHLFAAPSSVGSTIHDSSNTLRQRSWSLHNSRMTRKRRMRSYN